MVGGERQMGRWTGKVRCAKVSRPVIDQGFCSGFATAGASKIPDQ
jgi:hypothetical protein